MKRNPSTISQCQVFLSSFALQGFSLALLFACCQWWLADNCTADDPVDFFERKIRPVLIEHCYQCHSSYSKEIKGGLQLDLKTGWQLGGDSGEPAIVPGKPDDSLLIKSVRHEDGASAMPPRPDKLPATIIADLTNWVKTGAIDPREGEVTTKDNVAEWEATFHERLDWWSLKPIARYAAPEVQTAAWGTTDVDRFILKALEAQGLQPAQTADRRTLIRRLSFALTGLPPAPQLVERYLADYSQQAYDDVVTELFNSPHFGEHWARHWMDVVHYSDTHGYEWDVPAKNAWRYRDYLIRAFNADVPFRQLIIEQIAGDLLSPRIDSSSGINDALIGPMMLRLGERRHGDNAAAEGVTQEGIANAIDTLGKAFLGTTLACAQCHDHKLDAVEQRDYYALAGMLMSTRFSTRAVDATDPNISIIEQLRGIKLSLRHELALRWLEATEADPLAGMRVQIQSIKPDEKPLSTFPGSLTEFWKRSLGTPVTAEEFTQEHQRRIKANQANLELLADFTHEEGALGWRWEGFGMKHGLVRDGEMIVADEGEFAVQHLLPAGRFSHAWSPRLAGSLQSPQMDPTRPITFSLEAVSGKFASQSFIVDRALNPERLAFPARPMPQWQTLTAGRFDSLEGTVDTAQRRVYFELATKAFNNYFPPRVGYGGVSEAEVSDPRSWFGVTRVYQHPEGQAPQDDLSRFLPLYGELAKEPDWSRRLTNLLRGAVERWANDACSADDVRLLNDALLQKWLPNDIVSGSEIDRLVQEYRRVEKTLQPDRTVGSAADWNEGHDERLGIRGSYTELGESVERGRVRFLSDMRTASPASSGRLEWAQLITDDNNTLVARVYVNRVWHYLFGAGLVRTTDDFGHLGEVPSHPELLDYLATWFVEEGWSTKKLIRLLVTSDVWRQRSVPEANSVALDPENRLWHYMPLRRLEAEAIRDALLAVSGRLDGTQFGPPIEPYRTAEDAQKRLFRGPLDGNGRRSLYLDMTLMEPPRFLALFNQPLPKQTVGRRDLTNVPDQALALLNDPFVIEMARCWSEHLISDGSISVEQRVERMLGAALSRPGSSEEIAALKRLVHRSEGLHSVELQSKSAELQSAVAELQSKGNLLQQQPVWQDAAHAVFNMKEFIYVR